MILPTKNGISTWGMKQNCLVSIDNNSEVEELSTSRPHDQTRLNVTEQVRHNLISGLEELPIYNNEYFLFKHLSKFVGAGSTFLDASGEFSSLSVSFKNAKGQIVTVIENPLDSDREIVIDTTKKQYKLILKANSITTLVMD
jgi:O-glycosyl hydrolase